MYGGVLAVQVAGDGVLQEGVPNCLQSLQVDGVIRVGHRQGLHKILL